MSRKLKILLLGAAIAAAAAVPAIAQAGGGSGDSNDNDVPITGAELERASIAALLHTGEGTVSDSEVGDEESYYEVEVTLDDGSQVDVQLDEDFNVVGTEADTPGSDD